MFTSGFMKCKYRSISFTVDPDVIKSSQIKASDPFASDSNINQ